MNATPPAEAHEVAARQAQEARLQALEQLESLGNELAKYRREAVDGRQGSGIEQDWLEDEEHYQGIDDANRSSSQPHKPMSSEGGGTQARDTSVRSTVFLNITRPYVDAASARVADMLLPTDDRNWAIKATPLPDIGQMQQDQTPIVSMDGQPVTQAQPAQPGQPAAPARPLTVADYVQQMQAKANEQAELAQRRIEDWLVECQYHSEMRKVIEDCGRLGTGVLKGPVPVARKMKKVVREGGTTRITLEQDIRPVSKRIDPWRLYPDPSCGENIHNGNYIWEEDEITARQLRKLMEDDSYIQEHMQLVLEEGPQRKFDVHTKSANDKVSDKERYQLWYYYGDISRDDLEAAGCECDDDQKTVPAMITMVNDRVIRASINAMDSGEFPYDVMCWQRRSDYWAGIGVARQVRTPQRMLNASVRNMMDNAGISAGPQLVLNRSKIEPANGKWELTPRKIWWANEDADNVNNAFAAINIPTMQEQLFAITQYAQKMAEDVTGFPMLMQGQQGRAPDTVGGMQILNNNGSTVMRRIARTYDDCITEPHIRRYYEWLLIYGPEEKEKGDFLIDARGSTALVERDLQNQVVGQMGAMVKDPAFGLNPKKWMASWLKGQRLDVKSFEYSEEELQQVQASMTQQQDPGVQAATIRANADLEKAKLTQQDREQERQFRLQELELERQNLMLKLSHDQKISLEKIKAALTQTAMTEKNKRDLYNAEQALKLQAGSGI